MQNLPAFSLLKILLLTTVHSTGQDNTINFWPRLGVMVDDHSKPPELRKESYSLARMEERYPHERYLPAY